MGGKKGAKGGAKTSWADVVSKGKTKGKKDQNERTLVTRKRHVNSGPFKLREQDWPNHIVVPLPLVTLLTRKELPNPLLLLLTFKKNSLRCLKLSKETNHSKLRSSSLASRGVNLLLMSVLMSPLLKQDILLLTMRATSSLRS